MNRNVSPGEILAPILAFIVLPFCVWAWYGLGLDRLASQAAHTDLFNIFAGVIFALIGIWWVWRFVVVDVWPAVCRFGNWLGRP